MTKSTFYFGGYLALFFLVTSCGMTNSNTRGKVVAPEDVSVTQIPFDTIQNLMIVEAEINGNKGRFLFDNGFTLSAISPRFAEKCGIDFDQSVTVKDINLKKISLAETTVPSIIIGGFDFQKTGFFRIDTKKFFPCEEVDGVIGGSIINKVNWKIEYRDRSIRISEDGFEYPEEALVMPVSFNGSNSAVTTLTMQEENIAFKVDMGMSSEMALKKAKYASLYEGFDCIRGDGVSSLGASGLGNIEYNYDLKDRIALACNDRAFPVEGELELEQSQKYDGYIGVGYFKHYNFILNSKKKEYILMDPITPNDPDNQGYGINLYMVDGTCRITKINGFDPLLKGIELMSAVKLIDDRPTSEFRSVCELRAYLKQKNELKTDLVLQFEGDEEPIVLPYRKMVTGKIGE